MTYTPMRRTPMRYPLHDTSCILRRSLDGKAPGCYLGDSKSGIDPAVRFDSIPLLPEDIFVALVSGSEGESEPAPQPAGGAQSPGGTRSLGGAQQ